MTRKMFIMGEMQKSATTPNTAASHTQPGQIIMAVDSDP